MSTDRDTTRIVRSWLEEGATALPDRVLDAVLDQVPATPQRRSLGLARRFPVMNNNIVRFGVAAAAVVLAVIVGINVLPGANFGGEPEPTPTPSPSGTPVPLPSEPSSLRLVTGNRGPLQPGTYVAGGEFSVPIGFTVPAGWWGYVGGPYFLALDLRGQADQGIYIMTFDDVAADPCHSDAGYLDPPPGSSVDDLATALANVPGIEVTDVSEVSTDGYSGTRFTMSAPDSFAECTLSSDGYAIWRLPLGAVHSMVAGERDQVWILSVAGERLVIRVPDLPGYTDEELAEIQAIVDSISIEPAN